MGWSMVGGILYPPAVTPPPGAVPVSAPPPAPAAPTPASASGGDGDYKKWLSTIGLFSGLANTGGQSASDLVAGIVNPSPSAPQAAFSGLTPAAAVSQPQSTSQTVLPAAAPGDTHFNNWYSRFVTDALGPQYNPAWNPETGYNSENPYLPSKYSGLMDMELQRAALQDYGRITSGNNGYTLPDNVDVLGSLRNAYDQGSFHVQDQNNGGFLFDNPVSRLIDGVGSSPEAEQLFQSVVMYYLGGGAANALGGAAAGTSSATAAGAANDASNAASLGSTPSNAVAGSEYGAPAGTGSGTGMLSSVPSWAARPSLMFGSNYLTNGGDARSAAKNTAVSTGIGYGADLTAPYVNDALGAANAGDAADVLRRKGMLGTQVADASSVLGPMSDAGAPTLPSDPANYDWMADTSKDNTFATRMSSDPFTPVDLTAPAPASSAPAPAAATNTPPAKPAVTSQDLQRYAKIGMQVNDLIGAAKGAPQQPPADATPEDQQKYYSDVVNYLGLDAKTMADAGLTPGSPEYTQYILDQADTIIAQTMQGLDVNSADLAAQLHTKTDQELQQLQRALYVRGQLGQQMGAGTYVDPATGTPQEVLGGGMFDPSTAAYQRGLAGNVNELAGKQGQGAHDYLTGMLNRHADMFGMQGTADAQFEQAKRNEQNPDDLRRRRGMLGG